LTYTFWGVTVTPGAASAAGETAAVSAAASNSAAMPFPVILMLSPLPDICKARPAAHMFPFLHFQHLLVILTQMKAKIKAVRVHIFGNSTIEKHLSVRYTI